MSFSDSKAEVESHEDIRQLIVEEWRRRLDPFWVGAQGSNQPNFDRMIFCNGCFDILHVGHLSTLAYARSIAGPRGVVVVGINSDVSVKKLKGSSRPVFDENARGTMLASLKYVDFVVSFDEETPYDLIKSLKPDVIVKGGDYKPADVVGGDIATVAIAPLDENWSTTDVIERIKKL